MSEKFYKQRDFLYQAYWIEGLSIQKIRRMLKISNRELQNLFEKYNIPRRSLSEAQANAISKQPYKKYENKDLLYQCLVVEKLTVFKTSEIIGCCVNTIKKYAKKYGIEYKRNWKTSRECKIDHIKNNYKLKSDVMVGTSLGLDDIPQWLVELQREKLKLKYTAEGII